MPAAEGEGVMNGKQKEASDAVGGWVMPRAQHLL
jgi:hypothetical protein